MSRNPLTGRASYPAPPGEMITRHGYEPLGDDKAALRVLAETAIDLAEQAGANPHRCATMRRLIRRFR